MSVLRVYDPVECDSSGVPLDWDRCRNCANWTMGTGPSCGRCAGHGSLRAAALAHFANHIGHARGDGTPLCRCEGCGHPMSEGTWEPNRPGGDTRLAYVFGLLRDGEEPEALATVHYSPCDEGCRHGGPWFAHYSGGFMERHERKEAAQMWASWRPVDVRTLGWAHDLRPENLAVTCLRCDIKRRKAAGA